MAWNSTTAAYNITSTIASSLSSTFRVGDKLEALDSILSDHNEDLGISEVYKTGFISDDVMEYFYTINVSIFCAALCLFGVIANIINITVFWRQGFQETVNIALMGMSISDFFAVLSLLWLTICYNPLFRYSDVPLLTVEVQHITGGWTHVMFTRLTAFLTAYVTLERCLCIAFPFKIKTMLTPKRVTIIIIMIYAVIIGSMSQNYFSFRLVWKFIPSKNRTMFGMISSAERPTIQKVTYYLNILYPLLSFTGVVTCSTILILKLKQRGKWLNTATSGQEDTRTSKDRQVVKLIVSVAVIFICCFTPSVFFFLIISIEPELNVGRRYENLFNVICSIADSLGALNSSLNIFVYYKMSSKYRMHFRKLFFRNKDKSTKPIP